LAKRAGLLETESKRSGGRSRAAKWETKRHNLTAAVAILIEKHGYAEPPR